jgi:hypothetical protein
VSQAAAAAKAKDQEGDKKRGEHDKEENKYLRETEKEYDVLNQSSKAAMLNLCSFITRNTNLIHVNVSGCGLIEQQLQLLGRALRRAYQLRSIHITGNPGATDALKAYLVKRAHCLVPPKKNTINIKQLPSKLSNSKLETDYLE